MQNLRPKTRGIFSIIIGVVIVIAAIAILSFGSQFFYLFKKVDAQEIGVQFTSGRIKDIVGPGVYSDFGLFVSMIKISSQAIPFTVDDAEIITKDKQRMGRGRERRHLPPRRDGEGCAARKLVQISRPVHR